MKCPTEVAMRIKAAGNAQTARGYFNMWLESSKDVRRLPPPNAVPNQADAPIELQLHAPTATNTDTSR
eukprot:6642642-Alexandrium_andersonii.AAC.1